MSLFGNKKIIMKLEKENSMLKDKIRKNARINREKDKHFKALMSDALRHGSPLGGKYMSDRNKHLKGK